MSDLEDDLLALAGGADESGESDGYEPADPGTNAVDSDDEALSNKHREDDELVNPYPLEGKYKDEKDRINLESMDEIQREQILFDRTQEMERYNEKKYLQERMNKQREQDAPIRTSNRSKGSNMKSSKLDKLNELRKQREKKSKRSYDDYEEDDDEEEEEEEEEEDDYDLGWTSSNVSRKRSEPAQLADVNRIRVGRSMLTKYCFFSDFPDVIVDTFARINLGMDKRTRRPLYRMVKITDVQSHLSKAYSLGRLKCDIFLVVSQNRKQTKEFPITIFSDSPITEEEFQRYLNELDKTGESIDFVDDVNDKFQQVQTFMERGMSDKDVNQMLAKKQKLKAEQPVLTGYDAVFRKSQLMDELKVAKQQANNHAQVEQLLTKIKELDSLLVKQTMQHNNSESLNTMTKVNERNRKLNNANIRKAEVKSKQLGQSNQDNGDPFYRLKTVTRMFYHDLVNKENEKAIQDAKDNFEKMLTEKSEKEEQRSKSTYRVLGEMDVLISGIDIDF